MQEGLSKMIEVKTSELVGPALDWAVAKAEGHKVDIADPEYGNGHRPFIIQGLMHIRFRPSTDWSQGGPLIQKYQMDFCCEHPETIGSALCDENGMYIDDRMTFGKTHLIAACRALAWHKLGDTVQVPAELLEVVNG